MRTALSTSASRHKLLVKKRDGSLVPVRFDEITDRLTLLCETEPKLDYSINPFDITKSILDRIKNGITTSEIDDFAAEFYSHKSANLFEKIQTRMMKFVQLLMIFFIKLL